MNGFDYDVLVIGSGFGGSVAALRLTEKVAPAGSGGIRLVVTSAGGIPVAPLGLLRDITVPLPALPPGMTVDDVSVTSQGLLVHLAGQNVSFGADG